MNRIAKWARRIAVSAAFLVLPASAALAQEGEEKELGWAFEAELGSLWTGGNQETTTLSALGKLEYVWPTSRFRFQAGGFTTESSLTTTTAVGTGQDDFQVIEDKNTETTAETYYSRARFDHDISDRFFAVGGVDWLRNPFSGIDSRFLVAAGAGNKWVQSDRLKFETDYFVTYTFEEEVVANPITESNFPGLRIGYDLEWLLTANTTFESNIVADFNLDNTDDIRLDWYNGLPIDISSVLAFKPGLRLLWRNDPALESVPLFDAPGGTQAGTVLVPLEKLDTYFSVALVFTF
jgi:putative salt-induced outer membrane protein YdiY